MTSNTPSTPQSNSGNLPVYQAVIPIEGDNGETTWKQIGAAWLAKGQNGFNLVLSELPFVPDGKQTIYLRPRQNHAAKSGETAPEAATEKGTA